MDEGNYMARVSHFLQLSAQEQDAVSIHEAVKPL